MRCRRPARRRWLELQARSSWSAPFPGLTQSVCGLLPAVVVRRAEKMDGMVRIAIQARAVDIYEVRPGPVVGAEPVEDVIEPVPGSLVEHVFRERVEAGDARLDVGQRPRDGR